MDPKVTANSANKSARNLGPTAPSKLEFNRKDSGYISSSPGLTSTPATSSTEGTVIRRSLSSARVPSKDHSGDTSPETDLDSPLQLTEQPLTLISDPVEGPMQCTVSATLTRGYEEDLPAESNHQFGHLQNHITAPLKTSAPRTSPSPTNLNTDDRLLLAFECRGSHTDWTRCTHPYCYQVRRQWDSFKNCCSDILRVCPECSKFKEMILTHSRACTNQSCPVPMCSETRNLLQVQKEQARKSSLVRSQSFQERTPVSEHGGLPFFLANFHHYNSNDFSFRGYSSLGEHPDSVTMEMIHTKAQEIVDRLDKEEPLINSNPAPVSERPSSLRQEDLRGNQGVGGSILSPIVEMREDSLASPSENYSFENPPVSLILRSHQFESYGAYSSIGDGPGDGQPMSLPAHISLPQPTATDEHDQKPPPVYPRQDVVHRLDNVHLIPGQDGFYFQERNYYLNDVDSLGSGGFGACMFGRDHATEHQFAMKRNTRSGESIIDSMKAECFVLSRLKPHNNVVGFFGAVIDEGEPNELLPRVYKMFMELADCGDLSEMLKLENGNMAPLDMDQSLYYIEQILQGVYFLHQNSVLHLDIKAKNVLVFDGGRTVKLADFGTAVQLSEIAAVGGKITGCTPYFAAPEVVREEQPWFSSDIWSVMCVLVELLTAKWPGCHSITQSHQQMIFLVGQYTNSDVEQLIPFSKFEEIDDEIEQLIRCVFVANPQQRPSALTLLNHPRIREAPEYVSVFDSYGYGDGEDMSTSVSCDVTQQALPSLGPAAPIPGLTPSQAPLASQYPPAAQAIPYTPPLASHYPQGPYVNGPPSLEVHNPNIPPHPSHPYSSLASMDTDRDHPSSSFQHSSHGSEDGLNSLTARGYPLRPCSSGGHDYKTLDSGLDTAVDSSTRSKYSNNWSAEFPTRSISDDNYHSYPFTDSGTTSNNFQRSASITGASYNSTKPHSLNSVPVSQSRRLVPSTHRLYHSYSAPVVGDSRRKLSLQMTRESEGEGRHKLRRTSSMVYVDKGPEIDSPDREKRASIEELISDVSCLNLEARSPSHSGRSPAQETGEPETVVRQYGRGQFENGATPSNQKPVTVYETIC